MSAWARFRLTRPGACSMALDFELIMKTKYFIMSDILYILAAILIIGWILGYFVFSVGGLIHILLVVAIIAVVLRLIRGRGV
jgi:hypothetical protein